MKWLHETEHFPTKLGGHHLNLIQEAAIREGMLTTPFSELQDDDSYLTSFQWLIQC